MRKHTPGPWMVVTSWCDHMVEGPNGEEIIWQDGPYDTPTIKLANARLIAFAPDMYGLLEQLAALTNGNVSIANMMSTAYLADTLRDLGSQANQLLDKIEGGGE